MTDIVALMMAGFAVWAIWSPLIPTGILGSLGLVLLAGAALVSVDDSSFANVTRLEGIVIAQQVGFILLVAQVIWLVWRSNTGKATPRRRSTDFGGLNDARVARE